jgi:hypothetical protein
LVGGTAVLVVLVFVLGCRWCVLPDVFLLASGLYVLLFVRVQRLGG